MSPTLKISFVCALLLLGTACGSARLVNRTQYGGTIALEGDRQKAMEDAHRLMQQHCQGPYQIVQEGEVVIGSDTGHSQETYVTDEGETVVTEGGSSTRQATEWRVEYQCGGGAPPTSEPPPEY